MRTATDSLTYSATLLLLLFAPAHTLAQTAEPARVSLTTGIALTSQYDDETHLGRGVLLSVGVSSVVAAHLRLEGELSFARHHRDAGTLAVTGTSVTGTARAAWMFGSTTWAARPFVSVGALLVHSQGDWVQAAEERRTWRLTKPGVETGIGLEIRGKGRLWWRPEARFSSTTGDSRYQPGRTTLESPILAVRAGLTVLW
jgi:hypothetical protein